MGKDNKITKLSKGQLLYHCPKYQPRNVNVQNQWERVSEYLSNLKAFCKHARKKKKCPMCCNN